jgi:DNA polymerase IV
MEAVLRRQADRVTWRLRGSSRMARTITLKVRFSDFKTITRSETLPSPTCNDLEVFRIGQRLLSRAVEPGQAVRLLGLGCSGFEPEGEEQLVLETTRRRRQLDEAVDAIRSRFGSDTIGPGTPHPG